MHGADAIAAAGVRSATSAAAPGRGALTFSRVGERTVVRRAFSTSPLKLLNPQNHGSAAWVYLASYGGGLVGGDALRSGHLHAGFDQGLSLAARREPALARRRCRQRDASPCARSDRLLRPISYAQEIEIRLAQHGVLVLVDWLVAGRVASGERWQLDR